MRVKTKIRNLFKNNHMSKTTKISLAGGIATALIIVSVGIYMQLDSRAAVPVTSFEAENSTRSGGTTTVNDAAASAGVAIKFGSAVQPPTTSEMLMCSSASDFDHGGTEEWDAWRVYRENKLLEYANRTGSQRPKALAYSEAGENLGGANPNYNTVYSHVLSKLNSFYYTSASGQTHSSRWGIKLYWSNGNENFDKGALTEPHTTAKIAAYTTSQKALYDAVHYVDPSTGQPRFPDAFAGSNPTHFAEKQGLVEDWLHASAQYHDFVMWSMYPPGRDSTATDPTFNWPTYNESQMGSTEGFMIRTFYRTKQAEAHAGHPLMIATGEIGIAADPDDGTTRPYYAVYGFAHAIARLAKQYDLEVPYACWWDSEVNEAGAVKYQLSEEPTGLNPSTRQAWQNWKQYDRFNGGTLPSSWQNNPKSGWKTSGTHPTQ